MRAFLRGAIRCLKWAAIVLVIIVAGMWAFGALWFDAVGGKGSPALAGAFAVSYLAFLSFGRKTALRIGAPLLLWCGVCGWWLTLKPSRDRAWQPDVARTPWAEVAGDTVSLHNVRNCEYRTELDYTPVWENRDVHLSAMTGIDCFLNFWGSPWIAHPIISFQFADAPPVAISIETRKVIGESYSALRGFYRQYELIYLVADERDVVRVRTNFRHGEDVYLYHLRVTPQRAREVFVDYVRGMNALHEHAAFYNALTSNCTTNVRVHTVATAPGKPPPWDWRILLNGKLDEMAYERGVLENRSLPFAELKSRSQVNSAAQAAGDAPDFSARIRRGLPGFTSLTNDAGGTGKRQIELVERAPSPLLAISAGQE